MTNSYIIYYTSISYHHVLCNVFTIVKTFPTHDWWYNIDVYGF